MRALQSRPSNAGFMGIYSECSYFMLSRACHELDNLYLFYASKGLLDDVFRLPSSNFAESTTRNCETCGTYMIPYPLSTGPKCGDPMCFNFYYNISTGQVNFESPGRNYRVTTIYPETRKFIIQINGAENCGNKNKQDKALQLNESIPFNVTSWCNTKPANYSPDLSFEVEDEVEIGWDPPPEPTCSSLADCKDWPNSTLFYKRRRPYVHE
ncbi:hypothetical protein CIPAW_03G166200 [Carya illinoinensis]|uniref:Uncharacterized protein n=1 Tax=Carya illinoinensis TaxID=32201 RepID=A0A8T1R1N2_CARIL|nr:hypothetical protein CIPAW_03G166200 [Carya illinoinensis]